VIGIGAEATTACSIYARTGSTDDWTAQIVGIRARIAPLDARGATSVEQRWGFRATHVARVPAAWKADLVSGRRLRRISDGEEWVIGPVRDNSGLLLEPHVRAYLQEVEAVTQ